MQKEMFEQEFCEFSKALEKYVNNNSNEWTIKGFIDENKNIFTISKDTKVISKILELHIFPKIKIFADKINFEMVLADCQNYYPDISFVCKSDNKIKFAVDIKTTYTKANKTGFCNGFTLGSHGEYFVNRESTKNIQFPYKDYNAHYVLGILYDRNENIDELKTCKIDEISKINSVIKNIRFFFCEKWKIASDISGSGNTANIGSITNINDLIDGNGVFAKYGEKIFDDYWMNYGKITIADKNGNTKKIAKLTEFLEYRGIKCQ